MKLKHILNENKIGVTPISPANDLELVRLIKTHCSKNIDALKKCGLYRGFGNNTPGYMGDLAIVDPTQRDRRSNEANNYFIPLIDNSPYWINFPKRGKSLICSGSSNYAGNYGEIRQVIPFDNAKLGVCEYDDFWNYPHKELSPYGIRNLGHFTLVLDHIQRVIKNLITVTDDNKDNYVYPENINIRKDYSDVLIKNYDELKNFLKEIAGFDYNKIPFSTQVFNHNKENIRWQELYKSLCSSNNLEFLNNLLRPNDQVYVTTYDKLSLDNSLRKEIWTDSESIAVIPQITHFVVTNNMI